MRLTGSFQFTPTLTRWFQNGHSWDNNRHHVRLLNEWLDHFIMDTVDTQFIWEWIQLKQLTSSQFTQRGTWSFQNGCIAVSEWIHWRMELVCASQPVKPRNLECERPFDDVQWESGEELRVGWKIVRPGARPHDLVKNRYPGGRRSWGPRNTFFGLGFFNFLIRRTQSEELWP